MTAEKLHEALNLLPGDLIAETDALRCRPMKTKAHGRRWAAMAACLAVVLLAGTVFGISSLRAGKSNSAAMTMQAPETWAAAEAAPEAEDRALNSMDAASAEDAGCAHAPSEEKTSSDAAGGYCGNTSATVYLDGEAHVISGTEAVALTDILDNLPYDPAKVCNCVAEFTIDTEMTSGYEINLTESFVRCELGQADLTSEQAQTIREILSGLEMEKG